MIKIKQYELLEQIGQGSFSTVWKATNQKGQIFAIKRMKKLFQNDEKAMMNQINLLKNSDHPNIVKLYEYFQQPNKQWSLVFEYCQKGDLQNYQANQGKIPQLFIRKIFKSIVGAVSFLHQNHIAHRDLKLPNILLTKSNEIKISDFGFSKLTSESELMSTFCGTPVSMAPQILQKQEYNQKCDTWSLGVILYQLVYNKLPFYPQGKKGDKLINLMDAVIKKEPIFYPQVKISNQCQDIIKKCLEKSKEERPSVKELFNHPWMREGQDTLNLSIQNQLQQQQNIQLLKLLLYDSTTSLLKQLMQHILLSENAIKSNLKSIQKYFSYNQNLSKFYINKIMQLSQQIETIPMKIFIQNSEFKFQLQHIKRFKVHLEEVLKQNINKQLDINTNVDKYLIKTMVKQYEKYLQNNQKELQKLNTIYNVLKLCVNKVAQVHITINYIPINQNTNSLLLNIVKGLNSQRIIKYINEELNQRELIPQKWLIEKAIVDKVTDSLELNIGSKIKKMIEMKNSLVKANRFD